MGPIRQGLLRVRVDFNHQRITAHSHRSLGHRGYEVGPARAVARIHHNRQVGEAAQHRHSGQIQMVAGVLAIERANAALAEDHVRVACRHDVLRGHQPFLDRGRHPPLQQHRLILGPNLLQQREVLHIAGPHLQHIRHFVDLFDVGRVHHLRDDPQSGRIPSRRQQFQGTFTMALERIGRSPRLEGPTPQELGPGRLDSQGRFHNHFLVFHGARARHHRDRVVFANGYRAVGGRNRNLAGFPVAIFPAGPLERLFHPQHLFNPGANFFHPFGIHAGRVAHQTQHHLMFPDDFFGIQAPALELVRNAIDLFSGCARTHHNDHD